MSVLIHIVSLQDEESTDSSTESTTALEGETITESGIDAEGSIDASVEFPQDSTNLGNRINQRLELKNI